MTTYGRYRLGCDVCETVMRAGYGRKGCYTHNLEVELEIAKGKLGVAADALEVYASDSNWYDRTINNRIEFHDGSDLNEGSDHAKEALFHIRNKCGLCLYNKPCNFERCPNDEETK